ncbi:nucleotidyltransferase domain-containing protein [Actinacidiphila bryophytorum]|uniref:nucleotidyltransferase domain-containing protein n=1 Tax=Actinacidiphila bryophytorum TaxID=1436133 RepID=UPI0021769DAF|nr:nucleotidyltransferase family protein [Actinacidiphila bryophytorum]UWE08644.1 nucleotidyltransferase family protein [Actinacidiphila bryophytorum]
MSDRPAENEQVRTRELLLLCSRVRMTPRQEGAAADLLGAGVDPGRLVETAVRHKVLQLAGPHIVRLAPRGSLAFGTKRLIDFYVHANAQRNRVLFAEAARVLEAFDAADVTAVPLKGVVLAQEVYPDPGLRSLNDLDFLIGPHQRAVASKTLTSLGYIVGDMDPWTGALEPADRETELTWRLHLGNLHPHVRLLDDPFAPCARIDLSYDATGGGDRQLSGALLDAAEPGTCCAVPCRRLTPVDFLLHIAVHLHKEATNDRWLGAGSEQNLIKFCDLREYALHLGSDTDWKRVARRAEEIGAAAALLHSAVRVHHLFADPFAGMLVSCLADGPVGSIADDIPPQDPALRDWLAGPAVDSVYRHG